MTARYAARSLSNFNAASMLPTSSCSFRRFTLSLQERVSVHTISSLTLTTRSTNLAKGRHLTFLPLYVTMLPLESPGRVFHSRSCITRAAHYPISTHRRRRRDIIGNASIWLCVVESLKSVEKLKSFFRLCLICLGLRGNTAIVNKYRAVDAIPQFERNGRGRCLSK